ncbi:MAG: GSCFA domain-containing protein [Sphingomonadales bacterium]
MSADQRISHNSKLLLLGSCFSDEIGKKLQENGFLAEVNPGGTIFHPLALSKLLLWALSDQYQPLRIFRRNDVYLSWDLSGTFFTMSEVDLHLKFEALYNQMRTALQSSSHLFITFGSSWAFTLKADHQIVANCHKASSSQFNKELTALDVLLADWQALLLQLQTFNPKLQVVFTVSPVRHLKDGLIANNRSKARLLLLTEDLSQFANCSYLEAYELVLDELRDYAFYKEDGAHPNQKATQAVWELLQERILSLEALKVLEEWEGLQKRSAHRILYPESAAAKKLVQTLAEEEASFFSRYPDFQRPNHF